MVQVLGHRHIRILICDDHTIMRDGTRRILEEDPGFDVVGEAADGLEAVEESRRLRPDVALVDVRMPGLNGIEATREILKASPETAVLALSAYGDDSYVTKVLEAGASGYLLKTVRASALCEAVRLVEAGETVLDQSIATKLAVASVRTVGAEPREPELTAREMDVLRDVCRGLRNKEIARDLGLSVRTVEGHLEAIFGRLNVHSRTEAVLVAVARNWFADDEPANRV